MSTVSVSTGTEVEPVTAAECAALFRARASTYGLISRLYRREVDAAFEATLREMRFPAHAGNDDLDEGYRLIASYLGGMQFGSLTELAVDYVRTFIGHGNDGKGAAYPYESVYRSEKHLLMQDARDEVVAIYREHGLDRGSEWNDPEDHAALELEFMEVMSERTADSLERGDGEAAADFARVQRSFLAEHALAWMPEMTREMRRLARTSFYQGLSLLTDGFLASDAAFLDAFLEA